MNAELILEQNGLNIVSFDILNRYGIKHGMVIKSNGREIDKEQVYKKLGSGQAGGHPSGPRRSHRNYPAGIFRYYPRKIEADGLMTEVPGIIITIHTAADCVPIFLADKGNKAVCLIHAGWKGTALGIAQRDCSSSCRDTALNREA